MGFPKFAVVDRLQVPRDAPMEKVLHDFGMEKTCYLESEPPPSADDRTWVCGSSDRGGIPEIILWRTPIVLGVPGEKHCVSYLDWRFISFLFPFLFFFVLF